MKECGGGVFSDEEHKIQLAKSMLLCLTDSKFVKNPAFPSYPKWQEYFATVGIDEIMGCFQHGDATYLNAIWLDNEYKFIDFDTIGIYPILYDFFRLLLGEGEGEYLRSYIKGDFDKEIQRVFECFNQEFNLKNKDKYLSIYYLCSLGRWNTNWAVLSEIPENYQFTRTAVINFR